MTIPSLNDDLARAYAVGGEAWPDVLVPSDVFAQRVQEAAQALSVQVSELALRDLYLATACVRGDVAASKHLIALCERVAQVVCKRSFGVKVEDLRQELATLVTAKNESGSMRLAQYLGRSSLYAWLRTCAIRTLRDAAAVGQGEVLDDAALSRFVEESLGPASSAERAGVIAVAKRSLDRVLAEMSERNRVVLRQKLGLGWSIDQIGEAHGVHRATAARWVENAKDELRDDLLDVLRAEIGDEAAFDSVCAQISDSLFSTLARHLRLEV